MQEHSLLVWLLWKVIRRRLPPNWFKETQSHSCEIRGCSGDTMATHISIIVLLPLLSPEGLYNETLTPQTGSNCNTFYCSATIWILMPACPGWPRLTIWKPKGSKSLYIMHDLRVPQSVRPAPNNEWRDTCLCRKGRFGTLRFGQAIYREYLGSEHSLSYTELFPTCVYCPGLTKTSLFFILNFCTLKEQ